MHTEFPVNQNITEFIPVIRMLLSNERLKICRLRHNDLNSSICQNRKTAGSVSAGFKPAVNSLWDGGYIYLEDTSSPGVIIRDFMEELSRYRAKNSNPPKIIIIKGYGVLAAEDTAASAEMLMNEFNEAIARDNANSGGTVYEAKPGHDAKNQHATPAQSHQGILNQKICIVTGGAQGFGEGISRSMVADGANLVIADLNEEKGISTAEELKSLRTLNDLVFVKTDVSNPESVQNLVTQAVKDFGGIDIFISNAGVLAAGGLDEMELPGFELMTKINYTGYFLCAKYASAVMKLQGRYKEGYYSDIIQVNSKSGLKGSNRNFAYSGGKFGGIGLTQSFALELAADRVKVNAICPGNFFDGPLWSDPEKGLFVQYLNAGKVPGAKTVEDIKHHYEKQVPLGRGCRIEDVMKALVYIVSQEYETGQAVPVTGGQVMLG